MTDDLFTWARRQEFEAARRAVRLANEKLFAAAPDVPKAPRKPADVISFAERQMAQVNRLLDSAAEGDRLSKAREAGSMPAAQIIPFDDRRRA